MNGICSYAIALRQICLNVFLNLFIKVWGCMPVYFLEHQQSFFIGSNLCNTGCEIVALQKMLIVPDGVFQVFRIVVNSSCDYNFFFSSGDIKKPILNETQVTGVDYPFVIT